MAAWITVELNDLKFFANHGLHAEEAVVENEFKVDICLSIKAPKKIIQSIKQTVNYAEVYNIVEQEFAIRYDLLETCAMHIAQRIAEMNPVVKKMRISIKKSNPPIVHFTGSVGVVYAAEFK